MEQSKELVLQGQNNNGAVSIYGSGNAFEQAQRVAKMLASSTMVPEQYQNNVANTMVALEMAHRAGTSPLMVMQNLHVISGRPSWSSSYIIASINSCGRFAPIRFDLRKIGAKQVPSEIWEGPKGARTKKTVQVNINDQECTAWTVPAGVNIPPHVRSMAEAYEAGLPVIEGSPVSIEMAVREGWYTKQDSKWKTMPDLMLRYRAAAFFGRLHCPEILMGMHDQHEAIDISNEPLTAMPENNVQAASNAASRLNEKISQRAKEKQNGASNDTLTTDAQVIDNTGKADSSTSGDIL
jgi:hypothetical protein